MTRGVRLRCVSRKQDSKETKLSRLCSPRCRAVYREALQRDTTSRFCCRLQRLSGLPGRLWEPLHARHRSCVRAFFDIRKRPACPPGPFCCRCLCFYCCGHHGGLMNGGPVFRRTLVASALRTLLGIARTSGDFCSVHFSTASVTLSETAARVCVRARECV